MMGNVKPGMGIILVKLHLECAYSPLQAVKTADTETQTEREDRDSPERKRKKTAATVAESEILRDGSGDSNDASLEITDDEEEQDIGGREVTRSDNQDDRERIYRFNSI